MRIQKKIATAILVAASMFAVQAQATTLLALTSANELVRFNQNTQFKYGITGLSAGEVLLGIDLRPTDGKVYSISNTNKLYTIDVKTGAASLVFNLTGASFASTGGIGIDFNPQADFANGPSLRVTTGAGNNYAVNVNTGAVGNTSSMIGAGFTANAYTNSAVGVDPRMGTADVTDLYYINTSTDTLNFLGSSFNNPSAVGGIQVVGTGLGLGFDVLSANGFDIFGNGSAFAALNLDDGTGQTGIYSINLATGLATKLSSFNGTLRGLTQSTLPVPEPETFAMFGLGLATLSFVSRRKLKKTTA